MSHRFALSFALFIFLFVSSVFAKELPNTKPEFVGLSNERLEWLRSAMEQAVEKKKTAGVVALIVRDGKVAFFEAFGKSDIESAKPMQRDTIFRIASQTKAFTSVAIMMLVEEGKISLTDPLSKFLPAFKNTTVAVAPAPDSLVGSKLKLLPAKRPITIRDLLTHTSGLSYGFGPGQEQWKAAGMQGYMFTDKDEPMSAIVERAAALPMDSQPGEKFVYGLSTDTLGVVVERVSGLPLAEFFRKRITEPLALRDTHFYLPTAEQNRLAKVYVLKDGVIEGPADAKTAGEYINGPRKAFSGGAGLLSTASDYARFLQMMLNGGVLDTVRLLSPKTVELMTSNHIGSLFRDGLGFGLGFEVTTDVGKSGRFGSLGEYGWSGAFSTTYWVDPKERLVAVFMTQLAPFGASDLTDKFRTLVYQSIIGPPKL